MATQPNQDPGGHRLVAHSDGSVRRGSMASTPAADWGKVRAVVEAEVGPVSEERFEKAWFKALGLRHHHEAAVAGWALPPRQLQAKLLRDEDPLHDAAHHYMEVSVALGQDWYGSLEAFHGCHVLYSLYAPGGEALYIGVTNNLGRRMMQHARKWWFITVDPWACTFEQFATRGDVLRAEAEAIAEEQPAMNRAGRVLIPRYLKVER